MICKADRNTKQKEILQSIDSGSVNTVAVYLINPPKRVTFAAAT